MKSKFHYSGSEILYHYQSPIFAITIIAKRILLVMFLILTAAQILKAYLFNIAICTDLEGEGGAATHPPP